MTRSQRFAIGVFCACICCGCNGSTSTPPVASETKRALEEAGRAAPPVAPVASSVKSLPQIKATPQLKAPPPPASDDEISPLLTSEQLAQEEKKAVGPPVAVEGFVAVRARPRQNEWKVESNPAHWRAGKVFAQSADGRCWFRALGVAGAKGASSTATGVSADGRTVVGSSYFAVCWRLDGSRVESVLCMNGPEQSQFTCTSADGSVVGGALGGLDQHQQACVWTHAKGVVPLGYLPGGGKDASSAVRAISADGSVLAGEGRSGEIQAPFLWTAAGGMVALDPLPGRVVHMVSAMSAKGDAVVGCATRGFQTPRELFRWSRQSGMRPVGISLGTFVGGSEDVGVTADGLTIYGHAQAKGGIVPFLRMPDRSLTYLPDLPGGDAYAIPSAMSADGRLVFGSGKTDRGFEAFVWDQENATRSLRTVIEKRLGAPLAGFASIEVKAVSPDGQVLVGWGRNAQDELEAFAARVPLP